MDATRRRRTRDEARQRWYALQRQRRFARFLGFGVGLGFGFGAADRPRPDRAEHAARPPAA